MEGDKAISVYLLLLTAIILGIISITALVVRGQLATLTCPQKESMQQATMIYAMIMLILALIFLGLFMARSYKNFDILLEVDTIVKQQTILLILAVGVLAYTALLDQQLRNCDFKGVGGVLWFETVAFAVASLLIRMFRYYKERKAAKEYANRYMISKIGSKIYNTAKSWAGYDPLVNTGKLAYEKSKQVVKANPLASSFSKGFTEYSNADLETGIGKYMEAGAETAGGFLGSAAAVAKAPFKWLFGADKSN